MATIGTFRKSGDEYAGAITTLSLQAKIRPHRPGGGAQQTTTRRLASGLCRQGGDRGGLGEALERGPDLPRAEARRPELQRPDLRQPLRRRGRRELQPHLVAPRPAQPRLRRPDNTAPPGSHRAGRTRQLTG